MAAPMPDDNSESDAPVSREYYRHEVSKKPSPLFLRSTPIMGLCAYVPITSAPGKADTRDSMKHAFISPHHVRST
jgi:hypothetical protein